MQFAHQTIVRAGLHQDTFRIVLERLRVRGPENPSHLGGYIHATAKNLVIAHFR